MKATDLHAIWSAPDNARLTAKQSSFRLPVHVEAKVSALCELYPSKTHTQIVGDLLAAAIDTSVEVTCRVFSGLKLVENGAIHVGWGLQVA